MKSNKKIIYVAHCVLNQNSVINGWERAKGGFNNIVKQILNQDIGIIQLPCPEFTYLGENRPPKTKEEYNTKEYRNICLKLAIPVVEQMKEYQEKGYELVGIIGINGSPSCDTLGEKGVFIEVLQKLMKEALIELKTIDVPENYIEGEMEFDILSL